MKRLAFLVVVCGLAFSAPSAFAQDPCARQGPFEFGIIEWYQYAPLAECWSTTGAAEELGSPACNDEESFEYGYGVSTIYRQFVVGSGAFGEWNVDARLLFDDPNNNSFNQLKITATVTHNSTPTTTTLFLHNGGTGDLSCYDAQYLSFEAVTGDTVKITVEGRNWFEDTVIQTTVPQIINSNIW